MFKWKKMSRLDSAGNVTKVTHNDQHRDIIASSPQRVKREDVVDKLSLFLVFVIATILTHR